MLPLDLGGRVAVVTGASRGIGRAIATRLAAAGATVVATARTLPEPVVAALNAERPGSAIGLAGPVEDPEFARGVARTVFQKFKRLDILVNNAGILSAGLLGMTQDADIDATLRVNLNGAIYMIEASSRLMVRGGGGSIINISSIIGRRGNAGQVAYAASKAGVIGATLAAAKELAPRHVRVNAVAPGYIETDMTSALAPEIRADLMGRIGMGRAGTPEDVADVVLFLASDLSRYVTGQVIGVDGSFVL
jgi:3-oxoacyl-[acyl-carrier protein] reductase